MSDILCIYHGNCADGFGAAWAVWKRFPDAIFHAGVYGQEPPDVSDKNVVLVDFCYKPDVLKSMAKKARSMLILDHHKSAIEEIKAYKEHQFVHMFEKYTGKLSWQRHIDDVTQDRYENADINGAIIYTVLDMERSGAMIAWQFFHPEKKIPQLIRHIEDRDLWKFKIGRTREVQANLFSHPYDFEVWDDLMFRLDDPEEHAKFVSGGLAIERKHHKDIAELLKVGMRPMNIGGYWVWVANLPYTMASDAGHSMCSMPMIDPRDGYGLLEPPHFAATYWDGPNGRTFSLRSVNEFDVSEIARKYGGGGHKNAAGFKMPIGWEGE